MWLSRRRWLNAFDRLPAALRRSSASGAARDPARAVEALAAELEAQAAAARFVDETAGAFPEVGGRGIAAVAPAEVTVLAVELRRLVGGAASVTGAGAPLAVHSADLASAATAVADRGGTVLGALGHRLLAEFRGPDRTLRAVIAAADVLARSSGGSGWSSIEAPHTAIAVGEAWSGSVDYRGRAEPAAIGPPFQRLERVLHDAIPGEIVLARSAYDEIAPALARAGETAVRRAGTVGAQEVYAIAGDAAARLAVTPRAMEAGGESPAAAASLLPPPVRFAGRYELRECLGASADADTWKAIDENGRWVVVKRLHDGTELDQAAAAEWLRVQRAISTLGSPWVVPTLDAAGDEGCLYLVRPYARTRTLRSILVTRRPPRGVALHWARQLAAGLASLHAAGLVHANVRPENVLVDAAGAARWIDSGRTLGRARRADGPDAPPEWREGRVPDAASDVFGLGALLEELLLAGDEPGGSPAGADDDLRRLVHTCLLEDPSLRYPSAAAVVAALGRVE